MNPAVTSGLFGACGSFDYQPCVRVPGLMLGQTEPSIPHGRVVKTGSSNSYHREVRVDAQKEGCAEKLIEN